MTKLQTVTIDRATWRRGGGKMANSAGCTLLFDPLTKMLCCLGFHSIQLCGATLEQITDIFEPWKVAIDLNGLNENKQNSDFAIAAIDINDDNGITERERERQLKTLGRKHGYRYVFIGKTPREYWAKKPKGA